MTDTSATLKPVNRYLYAAFRVGIVMIFSLVWRVRVVTSVPVPLDGPVILAPTHRSLLDIPLMAFVTRRICRFMAKRELWNNKAAGSFFAALGAFPVTRGAPDRAALSMAGQVLEGSSPLVVFPEGTRLEGPTVGTIEDGVAYLAMKAGAAIYPIGIAGSGDVFPGRRRFPKFPKIVLVIGEPIMVERATGRLDREVMASITAALQGSLQAASDEANALQAG